MHHLVKFAIASVLLFVVFISWAPAATYNYTVYPSNVISATPGVLFGGDGGFYTLNAGPVTGDPTTGDPGNSSLITNITGTGNYKYDEFQLLNLPLLFHTATPLTIGDLASITYNTKNNSGTIQDWDVRIYTVPESGDGTNFYHDRFEVPNPTNGDTNWHTQNAVVVNVHSSLGVNTPLANFTLPQLAPTYGTQQLSYISFLAGASGNSVPISTNLDGIVITLANGDVANINLAAVPEPSSLALLFLAAVGGVQFVRRHRATCGRKLT